MASRTQALVLALLACVTASLFAPAARADNTLVTHPIGTTSAPYGFVEYTPPGYDASSARVPVVIVLHGTGEIGDGSSPRGPMTNNAPMRDIREAVDRGATPTLAEWNAIFLAPQSPVWWNADSLDRFVDYVVSTYRVDLNRVYLTGLSMGGGGTWDYAALHADRLAAIVPICGASGGGSADRARMMATLPVRAFHAFDDGTVPRHESIRWVDAVGTVRGLPMANVMANYPGVGGGAAAAHQTALPNAGVSTGFTWSEGASVPPSDRFSFTLYRDGGHGIWGRAYGDRTTWAWLFAQVRGGTMAMPDAGMGGDAGVDAGMSDPDAGAAPDAFVMNDDAGTAPEVDAGVMMGVDAGVVMPGVDAARGDAGMSAPRADAGADAGPMTLSMHGTCSAHPGRAGLSLLWLVTIGCVFLVRRRAR